MDDCSHEVILSEQAAEEYFSRSRAAWKMMLISSSELHKRLRALDDLRGPNRSWTYKPAWIRRSLFEREEIFERDFERKCHQVANLETDNYEVPTDSNPILHCIVQLAIDKWEFHKGDADPHPSVPHGHETNNNKRKLDAYLGYTFVGTKPDGRLNKSETIILWNDDRFRRFAAEALEHFITRNTSYTFRVSNPRQLPKKR